MYIKQQEVLSNVCVSGIRWTVLPARAPSVDSEILRWGCCRSEGFHNRPGSRRVHGRFILLVGEERDSAVARELNEGIGAGKVSSLGILDRWAGELLGSVGLASMLFE